MVALETQRGEDLLQEELISSYVDDPLFVSRGKLVEHIISLSRSPSRRIIFITGEPGAGKTALLALLARQHPTSLRYFLRYDSQSPYRNGSATGFLLSIGRQLLALHPDLFQSDQLRISIEETIERITADGSVKGLRIGRLRLSPFFQYVIDVKLRANIVAGTLTGVEIDQIEDAIRDPAILAQFALYGPAAALLKQQPHAQISILIDALDELNAAEQSLLNWLERCGMPPENVRFIVASRPGLHLDRLVQSHRPWGHTITLPRSPTIQAAEPQVYAQAPVLTECAQKFVDQPKISQALGMAGMDAQALVRKLVEKADGNFLYLRAAQRMIDQAIGTPLQQEMLTLQGDPDGVKALYASFLNRVFIKSERAEVDGRYWHEWEVTGAILGVLAVARGPLSVPQIKRLGEIRSSVGVIGGLVRMTLAPVLEGTRRGYALYHRTLAEFITDPETAETHPELYQNPMEQHRQIASYYLGSEFGCDALVQPDDVERIDEYGVRNLAAHLLEAGEGEQAHTLVAIAPLRERWLARHVALEGSSAGYLEDVELLWNQATTTTGWNVARQIQYTLLRSNIISRSGTNAPAILPLLIETQQRTARQALDDALQVGDDGQRARMLIAIAGYLTRAEFEVAWSAAEHMASEAQRLAVWTKLIHAHEHASAARVQATWEGWRDQWERKHGNTAWVSELDEKTLVEQLSQVWNRLTLEMKNAAIQYVIAATHARNGAAAIRALAPEANHTQRTLLLKYCEALLKENQNLAIELWTLGLLMGEEQRNELGAIIEAMVEHAWTNLTQMTDIERTAHAQELSIIAPFLSLDRKRDAVRFIERMTLISHQTYALFAVLDALPESERARIRKEALALADRMISDRQIAVQVEPMQRIESLIGLMKVLTDQQRVTLLEQVLKLEDKHEREQALYEMALQWTSLPEYARLRLAAAVTTTPREPGDELEAADALLTFALSAANEQVREQAIRAATTLIGRLTDNTERGLALIGLAAVHTGQQQVHLMRQAVDLMRERTPEDIARLLYEAPLLSRETLAAIASQLPRKVQAALKRDWLIQANRGTKRGFRMPGLLRRDAHAADPHAEEAAHDAYVAALQAALAAPNAAQATHGWLDAIEQIGDKLQKMPSDVIADVVVALLPVAGRGGYINQCLRIMRHFTAQWDGEGFFRQERQRSVWKETLRAWASLERSDCLLALRVTLSVAPHILSSEQQEDVISVITDALQ